MRSLVNWALTESLSSSDKVGQLQFGGPETRQEVGQL